MKNRLSKLSGNQAFWPVIIFLTIILFNTILTGGEFLSISIVDGHFYGRIIDIFRNGGKLMILAAGMTMVLATGGTDISVGSVMAISGAIACSIINGNLFPQLGGSVAMAIILAVCAGIVCGLWNGFLVSQIKIQPIVATMILLVAGRGIAQLITSGKIITINSDAYYFINGGYILGLPFPLYIVLFLVGLLLLFVHRTAFGLFLESIGCNQLASKFAGIKVNRFLLAIYTISGAFASVAGLIESAGIKGADCNNAGLNIELDAILANNAAYIQTPIPAGTYTGVDYTTQTFGVKCLIIVQDSVDEDLIYDLCKALNEGAADMAAGNALLKDMTDPSFLCTQMPIPLHPGAVRYYTEIGALK